jgi:hypothetical protein
MVLILLSLLALFGVVVLTETGEEWTVDKLNESVQTKAEYVGWGTGATVPTKGGTDISTPATEARVLGTSSKTGSLATAKLQVVATITANGTKTITNAGLFTTAGTGSPPSGGSLIVWGDHTGVALNANDQIQYTFTLDPA